VVEVPHKSWRTFCGVDKEVFEEHLASTLKELSYEYEVREGPPSFILGDEPSSIYEIRAPANFTIKVFFASGDPILRSMYSFFGTSDALRGVCLIEVLTTKDSEPFAKRLLQGTIKKLPRKPWDLKHHPKFRTAPLALFIIKRRWKRWMD
jgi:hypothetical protein